MTNQTLRKRTFIYGAGGHGKVVADILLSLGVSVEGFIDDNPQRHFLEILGLRVIGDGNWLIEQAQKNVVSVALGIGDNFTRRTISARCIAAGVGLLTVIHPSSTIASSVVLGQGVIVAAGCRVNPDAAIGDGTILNTGSTVEHDCDVGKFAHISPHAVIGGAARIGDFSWLGIGSIVIQGINVGTGCIVGAGAVVIHDICNWVVAVGVPARIIREIPQPSL